MHIPASTYRVQLHKEFTFKNLYDIIDYLHTLGITTIYAAPIMQAAPGSMHGYDVTDPHTINPEIGTLQDLQMIAKKLKEKKMSWIQDIVPNHMAFHTQNYRLMDVLERGPASPYYNYFDINWDHHVTHLKGKLQVPFLGRELGECVEQNEIKLSFSEMGFTVDYFDTSWPLSLSCFEYLFGCSTTHLFPCGDFVNMGERVIDYSDWKSDKENYLASVINDEATHQRILTFLEAFNNDKEKLKHVLDLQYYRLAYWKHTEYEINYRRFFTVNELICLRMEDDQVLDEYHRFIHTLYKENLIQGLRIDHIDGLRTPGIYIQKLRKLFGNDCYIIAEKILESQEGIAEHWPLEGTSGYEFLAFVNQLITSRRGAKELIAYYKRLVPELPPYKQLVTVNKKLILYHYMAGEWDNLIQYLYDLGLDGGFDRKGIRHALGLLMMSMPVYRIYPSEIPLKGESLRVMTESFEEAIRIDGTSKTELDHLHTLLFSPARDEASSGKILSFARRLMQFTGPLTAKGVEDTTFYVYNALISHDEVGDTPSQLGISISNFHNRMASRQHLNPLSLNATATHDTKRGEDARLRLNMLCEFPEEWKTLVDRWFEVNKPFRKEVSGKLAPQVNDEYFIYQAILGGFPEDKVVRGEWLDRLIAYEMKVLREAKTNSDWAKPDEAYESACESFITSILEPGSEFLESFMPFLEKVLDEAHQYALAQVLIKITAPGIPDIYQGCELWDLSFVDPDNRRPVDYSLRMEFLDQLVQKESEGGDVLLGYLRDNRSSGIGKLFTTWKALNYRRANPEVFIKGTYQPVVSTGGIICAYTRQFENTRVLVVVPLKMIAEDSTPCILALPGPSPSRWKNAMTGTEYSPDDGFDIKKALANFPVGLFFGDQ